MGKCGAKELNYLSDVDVIFVADHPRPHPDATRDRDEAGCWPPPPSWPPG